MRPSALPPGGVSGAAVLRFTSRIGFSAPQGLSWGFDRFPACGGRSPISPVFLGLPMKAGSLPGFYPSAPCPSVRRRSYAASCVFSRLTWGRRVSPRGGLGGDPRPPSCGCSPFGAFRCSRLFPFTGRPGHFGGGFPCPLAGSPSRMPPPFRRAWMVSSCASPFHGLTMRREVPRAGGFKVPSVLRRLRGPSPFRRLP